MTFLDWSETGLAFRRDDDAETLLCLFNFADSPAEYAPETGTVMTPLWPEAGAAQKGTVTLPPLGILIARIEAD